MILQRRVDNACVTDNNVELKSFIFLTGKDKTIMLYRDFFNKPTVWSNRLQYSDIYLL